LIDRDLEIMIDWNGAPLKFLITLYKPVTFYIYTFEIWCVYYYTGITLLLTGKPDFCKRETLKRVQGKPDRDRERNKSDLVGGVSEGSNVQQ